jgi:hypothetical protein
MPSDTERLRQNLNDCEFFDLQIEMIRNTDVKIAGLRLYEDFREQLAKNMDSIVIDHDDVFLLSTVLGFDVTNLYNKVETLELGKPQFYINFDPLQQFVPGEERLSEFALLRSLFFLEGLVYEFGDDFKDLIQQNPIDMINWNFLEQVRVRLLENMSELDLKDRGVDGYLLDLAICVRALETSQPKSDNV